VKNLTPRQHKILQELVTKNLTRSEIETLLEETYSVSKATVVRDLSELIDKELIKQEGAGPATYYRLSDFPKYLPIIDLDTYFSVEADDRQIADTKFDFKLIDTVETWLSKKELSKFETKMIIFRSRNKKKLPTEVKKELERLIIELSWKSSKIEGNTYTLLDTENLIKNRVEKPNYTKEETNMILNHKSAFGYILDNLNKFKEFNIDSVIALHDILTKNLDVSPGLRSQAVGISGTKYTPLDNKYQIEDALNKLETKLSSTRSPVIKAFAALVFISYIQPFADGNKRTARLLSNGILLSNEYYPLSYRSVDEVNYKKALIMFYEQHNIYYFKEIFKEQYQFSVNNYFI